MTTNTPCCRLCHEPLAHLFLDLGFAPPSNAYRNEQDKCRPELYFPLRLYVCSSCWLVQTEDYANADDLFSSDYAYFSSTSSSWLEHAARYVAQIQQRLDLNGSSFVVEIAANDGYLLKNVVSAGIPCLGIEPTQSTAEAAQKTGVPVLREFFGQALAEQMVVSGQSADLIIGNNVYAHVPDINDFTQGLKTLLKPNGTITLEFPHLKNLIQYNQFDTVYHEHFSYLSLIAVGAAMQRAKLRIYDVEKLPTHGGSLRVYCCHQDAAIETQSSVKHLLDEEVEFGLMSLPLYMGFQSRVDHVKNEFLSFLIQQQRQGKKVAAYGAAAKGNTLLNFAGVKPDLLAFVCDKAAAKQGKYLPGSHLPIYSPLHLLAHKPDVLVILPWNIAHEVKAELEAMGLNDIQFVTAIPELVMT